jgi:hypothetical protein
MEIVVPVYLLTGAYWEDGAGVQLIGQGMSTSVVSFPQDLGAGRFAVKVDPEHVIAGVAGHQLIDLAIIGSPGGIGQASFGLPRYLMSGVMLLHKTRVTRSDVSGFFASAYVSTDHNYVSDSNLKSSGYAVYFGYSSTGGNGNTYVENVDCGNSLIGAIGIAWNNWASDCVFRNFAGDQFATFIYKENQGTNTATDPLLVNCVFDSCATEGISSSIFYDYNAVNHANYSGGVYNCVFINCLFSVVGGANWRLSATTSYFPSTTVYAAYDIGSMSENRWILGQVASSYDYSIVTLGIIRAPGGCNGNAYEGCGVWLVYATAAVPSYVNNVSYDTWDYQGVSGSVAIWLSGSDTVGAIVTNQNNYGILQPMANSFITGQSLSPALGVLMAPVSKSCGVAYATGGPVTVLCNASAGLQTGQAAYVDHATPGQANSASGNSGNARQYLGSVISAQSGTTAVVMWGPGPVI